VAAFAAAANALNLRVAGSGGNATSPLQYGTMFEVSSPPRQQLSTLADHHRISTSRAMVVFTPSSSVTELSKAVLRTHRAFSLTTLWEAQVCR
jgi:hypothetical protein